LDARAGGAGQGAGEVRGGGAGRGAGPVERRADLAQSRSGAARPGDRAHRRLERQGVDGHHRGLAAHRRHRCALSALLTREAAEDEPSGDPRGAQGSGRLTGSEGAHPPVATAAGAPTHDAGGADGRRGRHQPDALRRRSALRRETHARADRGGKGVDLIAARIREIATENNVPVFEAPPLARVLYRNVAISAEIPATLYKAVAQVLTYVFQLRAPLRLPAATAAGSRCGGITTVFPPEFPRDFASCRRLT